MGDKGGVLRLLMAIILCFSLCVYAFYTLAVSEARADVSTKSKTEAPQKRFEIISLSEPEITAGGEAPSATSESVPAASEGVVQGRVVERFISPYTAKNSYNNVYLKNNTDLSLDIKSLLSSPLGFKIDKSAGPQVLIVHTHTTESFMTEPRDTYTDADLSRTTDNQKNMVALGKIVADALNGAGIATIHDTTVHDFPEYNGSYSRAAKTITANLKKYPGIKIVLDIHRDAIAQGDTDKVKVTADINGKKAAQVMLVMGSQSGGVTNFPDYKENLKLAVRFQQTLEVMYPSLARALTVNSKNYNQSFTTGSLLLEIGTDGNTLEEVRYSATLVAEALKSLLNTL